MIQTPYASESALQRLAFGVWITPVRSAGVGRLRALRDRSRQRPSWFSSPRLRDSVAIVFQSQVPTFAASLATAGKPSPYSRFIPLTARRTMLLGMIFVSR